jgi:hypothetical protein
MKKKVESQVVKSSKYDENVLLNVIADFYEELFHTYGMSASKLNEIMKRAGMSQEVIEEFDLSDLETDI